MRSKHWLKVWQRKGKNLKDLNITNIIKANGFDSTLGKFNKKTWFRYISNKVVHLKLNKNSSILEYGCGAGAFLSFFYKKKFNLYGIDYSENLIQKAKKIYPRITFKVGDFKQLRHFKTEFDTIFSNSVFQYFNDLKYANLVILKMLSNLKPKGQVMILDIPDKDKEKKFKKYLIRTLGKKNYLKKYIKTNHLFYRKNFFIKIAKKNKLKIKIFDQNVKTYNNSRYRFNVLFKKD